MRMIRAHFTESVGSEDDALVMDRMAMIKGRSIGADIPSMIT